MLSDRGRAHYIGSVMAARRQTAPRNEIGNAIDTLERAEATAGPHTVSLFSIYCGGHIRSDGHFVFKTGRLFVVLVIIPSTLSDAF